MKVALTLTALALGMATIGMAQAAETSPATTRAQVVQQLETAEATGQINNGQALDYPHVNTASNISRADVERKLEAAESRGLINGVNNGEDVNYPDNVQLTSNVSRTQVEQQLSLAEASGLINNGEDLSYPAHS